MGTTERQLNLILALLSEIRTDNAGDDNLLRRLAWLSTPTLLAVTFPLDSSDERRRESRGTTTPHAAPYHRRGGTHSSAFSSMLVWVVSSCLARGEVEREGGEMCAGEEQIRLSQPVICAAYAHSAYFASRMHGRRCAQS